MNYFGHAYLAAKFRPSPAFVLGAMLPDLVQLMGRRDFYPTSPEESAGVEFHLKTDALFHDHSTFSVRQGAVLRDLREKGVSRGPARAASHVGVEMLIDAFLAADEENYIHYQSALAYGAEVFQDTSRFGKLAELLLHLHGRGPIAQSAAPDRLIFRLGRALAGRPRLAPTPDELTVIVARLVDERPELNAEVPALMADLLAGLHASA